MTISPSRPDLPEFMRRQYEFAANIRDPGHAPAPADVEDRRMSIYRELFYNNIESFIANSYPVLRQLMDDEQWHAMVRDFMILHRAHTPYFPELPREFLTYLEESREATESDPPFILELAHYEWIELALSLNEAGIDDIEADPAGDLLDGHPVVSPLAWPLAYQYPVHRISAGYQPDSPPEQPTYLLIYRDRSDEIGFIELNPVSYRLLQLIEEDDAITGRQAMLQVAEELKHPNPDAVINGGQQLLAQLRERDVIQGIAAG